MKIFRTLEIICLFLIVVICIAGIYFLNFGKNVLVAGILALAAIGMAIAKIIFGYFSRKNKIFKD